MLRSPSVLAKFDELNWVHHAPEKALKFRPIPYNCMRKRANSSIHVTQPCIIRFRSNFVWTGVYTHDTRNALKVQGQEIKGQGHSIHNVCKNSQNYQ